MLPIVILTCEHFSKQIPPEYASLFSDYQTTLNSHQGWDIGANTVYQAVCDKQLAVHHKAAEWSRLLVDLNRSLTNKNLFSYVTNSLSKMEQTAILEKYYFPYRNWVVSHINHYYTKKIPIIHLSIHSFTPELNGKVRHNDLGLLYDPKRLQEKIFCEQFKLVINRLSENLKIRFNYPYRGTSDGLTTFLRSQVPNDYYVGIEIEINQKHFDLNGNCKTLLVQHIVETIKQLTF